MKARFVLVLIVGLALLLGARSAWADTVVSVDPKAKVINVDTGNGLKAYRIQDNVSVRVNGTTVPLDQVQPGMVVTLGLFGGQTVASITAVTPAKPALGPSELNSATANNNNARHVTVRMKVDAKDWIYVKDGKLWIQHKSFQKPTNIAINGRNWKVVWDGDKTDEFVNFIPPLAPFGDSPVSLKKLQGRDQVILKQAPKPENGETLIVEIDDAPNGAAEYEVQITW